MKTLTVDDLYTLEKYARVRPAMRKEIMQRKQLRRLALGEVINLYFEDRQTVRYQVQEMLRVERIFEPEGIESELDTYNPLVPDGGNWKATMMIEVPDVSERRKVLADLVRVEHRVYMHVAGHARVYAIADEDLERSTEEKTSAVHFMRFELDPAMIADLRAGAMLAAGCDHEHYKVLVATLSDELRVSLLADLD